MHCHVEGWVVKVLKRVAVVLCMLLVVGALAGCGSKSAEVSKGSASGSASESAQSAAADYSNMSVGDTVKLSSGLEITVNEVEVFTPQYSDKSATRVNVTYANNGKDKQRFNMFDWKAENSSGVETSTTIVLGSENELNSGELRAGGNVTGNVYFDGDDLSKIRYYSNVLLQSDSDICWVIG